VALPSKKDNKCWVWKAYDRASDRLIDWECGARDAATLKRLLERLSRWDILLFCTDDLAAYGKEITPHLHVVSKSQTVGIERNNGRHRHWVPPFRRRSCIVSKSKEMLNAAIALFAAIHVNKTWTPEISLFS
jgi:insertion element IS1 protein InsB